MSKSVRPGRLWHRPAIPAFARCLVPCHGRCHGRKLSNSVLLDTLPPPIAAATWCADDGPGYATRRVFAGHTFFAVQCPSNNANFVEALVVADDNGAERPCAGLPDALPANPDNPNDALSNIVWHEGGVVSELFVDPEEIDGPCRHEARWRLAGDAVTPELVFWRETDDCSGETGWTVLVGE